jgi:hypothetical protein
LLFVLLKPIRDLNVLSSPYVLLYLVRKSPLQTKAEIKVQLPIPFPIGLFLVLLMQMRSLFEFANILDGALRQLSSLATTF